MKTALALGTFDGIHLAHRFVLDLPEGYKKTAVTFVKPPKMYIKNIKILPFTIAILKLKSIMKKYI